MRQQSTASRRAIPVRSATHAPWAWRVPTPHGVPGATRWPRDRRASTGCSSRSTPSGWRVTDAGTSAPSVARGSWAATSRACDGAALAPGTCCSPGRRASVRRRPARDQPATALPAACRRAGARLLPRPGGSVCHHAARRPWRRCLEARVAAGRRVARLGAAFLGRSRSRAVRVLRRGQSQQAQPRDRPQDRCRPGASRPPAVPRGHRGPQLRAVGRGRAWAGC